MRKLSEKKTEVRGVSGKKCSDSIGKEGPSRERPNPRRERKKTKKNKANKTTERTRKYREFYLRRRESHWNKTLVPKQPGRREKGVDGKNVPATFTGKI